MLGKGGEDDRGKFRDVLRVAVCFASVERVKAFVPATQAESTLIGRSSLLVLPSLWSWLCLDNIYLTFSFEFYIEQASSIVRGNLQSQIVSNSSQEDFITEKKHFNCFT